MAKWGEGDPRWIVEERPDATNVNNWHWSEKNASGWSKDKLKALLEGIVFEAPDLATITIKEISKCDGEAVVNNRKGKLIFFYEWELTIDWTAIMVAEPKKKDVKGSMTIPNLSEENEPHEIDVDFQVTSGGSAADAVKEYLRKNCVTKIQEKLAEYIAALKKEYAQDLILPTKGTVVKESKTIVSSNVSKNVQNTTNIMKNMEIGCKLEVTDINLKEEFKCQADELFRAFTIQEMVVAFTRGNALVEAKKDGKFELFDGNITGTFEVVEPNKKIVQKWRSKSWPSGHYSEVTLDFQQTEDSTVLKLAQKGIPTSDLERTKQGWRTYYWDSIKRTFGFGALLI